MKIRGVNLYDILAQVIFIMADYLVRVKCRGTDASYRFEVFSDIKGRTKSTQRWYGFEHPCYAWFLPCVI